MVSGPYGSGIRSVLKDLLSMMVDNRKVINLLDTLSDCYSKYPCVNTDIKDPRMNTVRFYRN